MQQDQLVIIRLIIACALSVFGMIITFAVLHVHGKPVILNECLDMIMNVLNIKPHYIYICV